MTLDGDAWPTLGEGGVPALWDQIPEGAKWQIITAIGCLEWYDEWQYDNPAAQMPAMADKPKHYMRGGQPGAYPCGIQPTRSRRSRRWRENSTPSSRRNHTGKRGARHSMSTQVPTRASTASRSTSTTPSTSSRRRRRRRRRAAATPR